MGGTAISTPSPPLVSVVIPTHRRPALLVRAVRSALGQTLREIEIVVVIDGEAGCENAEALTRLNDSRVRCIALDGKVGGAEARNIGIRSARAPWIALLDDDDEWLPEKLATQMAAARNYTGEKPLVITCRHIHRAAGAADVVRPRRLPRPGESPCEFMFDYLCYFQTSTFFVSTELLLKIPFTKDLPFFQDIDWFLRALSGGHAELLVVLQPLAIYYAPDQRATVTSGVGWKARLDWGRANRKLLSRRAYSRFVVGSCAGPAAQDRAGARGLATLLYESVFVGSPTPNLLILLLGTYLLRPAWRKKLRDRIFLRRAAVAIAP